jgi:hypothetical protein
MTSSYRDPNVAAAIAYQAEQEQRRKAQEQPNLLDIAGRTALGLGAAALAGAGIRGLMRRNAVRPINVEDLGATAARAEENVRRAARSTATPPPSRPAPPAGVARQQAAEEFTRQARAERPVGVSQVNIQDLIEPSFALPQEPLTGTPYSVSEVINLANQTKTKSPQVAERAASTVKLLPPARAQSTDFLRNQLGSRGYIEQSILDRVAEQSAGDLIDEVTAFSNKEARSELARQGASIQSQQRKNLWNLVSEIQNETLVDTQQARTGFNVDQAINALDAAEDQQTGRMKIQLQRNEDLDMSQVEVLEDIASQQRNSMLEMDEPINMVASQLPDGLPVDQAEGRLIPGDEGYEDRLLKTIYQQELEARPPALTKEDMERNIQNSLNRGLSVQLPSKLPAEGVRSLSSQELADIARDEMMARRQALSESGLRGERLERALGREPSRTVSQALEAVSPSDIDEAPLQERTLINIGPGAQIEKAASGTSIRGTSRIGAVAAPQEAKRQVSGPDYVTFQGRPVYTVNAPVEMAQDIPGARGQSTPPVERIDDYALKSDLGGGIGIYGVEPAFAAGAIRKDIDLFQIPKGRTPLGLSPGAADPMISTTEAAGRQPSAVPAFTEKNNPFRAVSTEAIQKMASAGTGSQSFAAQRELNRRTRNPEGLAISEAMRRARIEGRDPQVFLDKLMKERGVSAAAGTSSPIR